MCYIRAPFSTDQENMLSKNMQRGGGKLALLISLVNTYLFLLFQERVNGNFASFLSVSRIQPL